MFENECRPDRVQRKLFHHYIRRDLLERLFGAEAIYNKSAGCTKNEMKLVSRIRRCGSDTLFVRDVQRVVSS
ncbi:hypothetical protein D9M68_986380 [compost metagenome]